MAKRLATDRDNNVSEDGSRGRRGHGSGGPLERVTVNLVARASQALQRVSDITGDSKTDSINRAIQIYAYLEDITSRGGSIYVRESANSEIQRLKMFSHLVAVKLPEHLPGTGDKRSHGARGAFGGSLQAEISRM